MPENSNSYRKKEGARDSVGGGEKQIPRFARDDNFVGSSLYSAHINNIFEQKECTLLWLSRMWTKHF